MLRQNFKIGHQILNNVVKKLFFSLSFSNKALESGRCTQPSIYANETYLTPKQCKEKLKQCRRRRKWLFCCCRKLFFKPTKCKTTTASEEYLKARQSLKLRVDDMIQFIDNRTQSITNDMNCCLANSKAIHVAQLERLFKKTSYKLTKLVRLDASYGNWMRNETLLLNDEIRRSFGPLERAIMPNLKHITFMLKELRTNILMCAERADENITTCRRHVVPTELMECVNQRLDEATLMFDEASKEARRRLEEITRFCENIIKTHEITLQEVMKSNCRKSIELLQYLDRCIIKAKRC